MAASDPRLVTLRYAVACAPDDWTLDDEAKVPEAHPHHRRALELEELLARWAAESGRSLHVGGNLAIRWDEAHPRIGVDPDVYVVEPAPPQAEELRSLRLWAPGNAPTLLAVEIVSASHPTKDYLAAPEKYAASGTRALGLRSGSRGPARAWWSPSTAGLAARRAWGFHACLRRSRTDALGRARRMAVRSRRRTKAAYRGR